LLGAKSMTIWTDVDGVYSADPRRVPDAVIIPELSYQEAAELAYFGAKVIHPNTMSPAIANDITVWIKNSLRPEAPGTRISAASSFEIPIKGFAAVEDMALLNVEGTGMIGIPGVAHKLFGALRAVDVSVVMISQASSEHSICFAVPQAQAELAKRTVAETFLAEMQRGEVQTIDSRESCCIVAMVGDGMIERLGMSGKFFSALGKAGVNVRAIAQGSSERNISAVIEQHEATKALRAPSYHITTKAGSREGSTSSRRTRSVTLVQCSRIAVCVKLRASLRGIFFMRQTSARGCRSFTRCAT
jgi:aspartokinase/homoserine dehydrogenase 1